MIELPLLLTNRKPKTHGNYQKITIPETRRTDYEIRKRDKLQVEIRKESGKVLKYNHCTVSRYGSGYAVRLPKESYESLDNGEYVDVLIKPEDASIHKKPGLEVGESGFAGRRHETREKWQNTLRRDVSSLFAFLDHNTIRTLLCVGWLRCH